MSDVPRCKFHKSTAHYECLSCRSILCTACCLAHNPSHQVVVADSRAVLKSGTISRSDYVSRVSAPGTYLCDYDSDSYSVVVHDLSSKESFQLSLPFDARFTPECFLVSESTIHPPLRCYLAQSFRKAHDVRSRMTGRVAIVSVDLAAQNSSLLFGVVAQMGDKSRKRACCSMCDLGGKYLYIMTSGIYKTTIERCNLDGRELCHVQPLTACTHDTKIGTLFQARYLIAWHKDLDVMKRKTVWKLYALDSLDSEASWTPLGEVRQDSYPAAWEMYEDHTRPDPVLAAGSCTSMLFLDDDLDVTECFLRVAPIPSIQQTKMIARGTALEGKCVKGKPTECGGYMWMRNGRSCGLMCFSYVRKEYVKVQAVRRFGRYVVSD